MDHQSFRVYAGNMFCGWLSAFPSGRHMFTGADGSPKAHNIAPIQQVKRYKNLKLVRVS